MYNERQNAALTDDILEDYGDIPAFTQTDLGMTDDEYASYLTQGEADEEFEDLVKRIGIDAVIALPARHYCLPDGKDGHIEIIETYSDGTASVTTDTRKGGAYAGHI